MRKSRFSQTRSDDCLVRKSLGHSNSKVRIPPYFSAAISPSPERPIARNVDTIWDTQVSMEPGGLYVELKSFQPLGRLR